MAHVREQIGSAVGTLLSAAPTNWQRVFKARIGPSRDVLPYLLVYIDDEDVTPLDIHPGHLQERDYTLTIRARNRNDIDPEEIEKALDAMAAEIETTLTFSSLKAQLSGLKKLYLTGSVSDAEVAEDESRTFAEIALAWQVQVHTTEGAPETFV